jgi:endonuclease YncB( thermonuclease family)
MRLNQVRSVLFAVVVVLIALAAAAFAAPRRLGYVVDGDTVRLMSGVYVRFIGLDAPSLPRRR